MSQVSVGTAVTPANPVDFNGDTGTASPVADEIDLLGGDTTDNDVDGIRTVASGKTVTFQLTNRFQATGSTVGAVTDDLITFDLGATDASYRFSFEAVGRDTTSNNTVGYTLRGTFKTDGATATLIDTPFTEEDEDAALVGAAITMVASGNNAILRVTGVATFTISWATVGEYIVV